MIALLNGRVFEKTDDTIIVDVQGVGYGVMVSAEDFGALKTGTSTKLYIHEHIREVSHDLYGFTTKGSKEFFEQLLNVNGVGPKMALSILSIASIDQVKQAIAGGDTKFIQAASGVGKRVAERVIVDLKDKVGFVATDDTSLFISESAAQADDAVQGLVALGYDTSEAIRILSKIDDTLPVEERIKQALKG